MATEKDVAVSGNVGFNSSALLQGLVDALAGMGLKGGSTSSASQAGGGSINITQNVNVQSPPTPAAAPSAELSSLVSMVGKMSSSLDAMVQFASRNEQKGTANGESKQTKADNERRSRAETKAQTKAAEATARAMRDMQNTGEKATTAAAMDRRMKSQSLDVGEWQRRLAAVGASQPDSLTQLTRRMGVYNNRRTTAATKADAYKYVQDNIKQARLDTNRAIATGKMLQTQQKQIDAASKQADELLKNPLLDQKSDVYQRLNSAKGYMDQSANWGASPANTLNLRKGVLQGLTSANEEADKAVKAAEAAAKNAESQYKLLTSGANPKALSLPGQQQLALGNAYKEFQRDRNAETLRALQAEERAAQSALELQSYMSKRGGADMAQRAAQEKMDAAAKRAGGYERWSTEQKQWYDEAKGYQESLNKYLAKGAVDKATESFGLMNKALDHLNPSLKQSEKTITEANKANDKAAELAATPMSGSARNALLAASGGLDKALNGNSIQAVADATKNLVNVMDTAQKSAEAVAERAKATEKQQAALEKNSYTSPQAVANMQASRDRWLESQDTKDLGKYVASVKSATFGSMSNEMEALGKQLDMLRNPTGSRDNSTSWAAEQKRVLDDLTASRERYNQAVAKGDEAAANRALQETRSGLSTLKAELTEAQKLQQEIDKVRNNPRMTDSMKQQLDGVVNEWKTVGSGAEDYQRKVNAVRDSLQTMTQTMAQMDVAGKWNQAGTAVEKYTQKLNKASAGNGGDAYWTEYQRGLYKDAQTALGDMKAAQASGDLGAYNTAEKTFNGKLNALNAALMTTRGQMGGMNGQVDALSKSLANLAAPMMLWRRFSGYLKKASQNVSAIDSQIADLKKVTTNTNAEYQQFLTSSGQNAVAIGAKISDLVATTSTFAHMGYSLRDSQALGVTATKFANVGNFQNTTEAADAMIAVIKGFDDLSIGDADLVGDKLTAVANNYAVTANDIAEGLQKSASSLNVAGNNIDQSTAMITAIAEVTRDAGAAGSALKVLSMRIRGAKTELTDAGESTEGMAESTSKLRAQVKALTNVNGSGGVDILADEKTFRSTYDIMSDIADVWSGMSDIDQSALLELLAGKVRSNQVAALLSNFDQAEAALKTSQNAEGTMDKVHRAWMDSVEARKAQFEAAQETLSMTVMPANTLKGLYQTGTSALGLLNTVIGATSPAGFGAGIFGVANALRSGGGSIAAGLGNMTGWHRDMINGGWTRGDLGFVNAYNDAFSQTGDKQAAFNKAISQSNKQLDSYTMSLYSNTSGLIDVSKVTKSFGSQIASFAKNAAVGLATFGAMELAAVGLNAAWQWFNSDILHRGETLANNAATAHAEAEQASQAADTRREELQTVQEQIHGIEQKRQTSGGLTSAEEAELMELRSQQRVAQYRQDIAEAQEKSKSATAVAKRTKSYEWDRATQTTLGAALPGATSGVNALDAFEAALGTARDRLKTLNKGSQEYLDTQEDIKTLSAWHRQLNFRLAASKAGSVEGQALLARYGQAQDLDLAGRYQSKVNDRVAKLDGSYADLQARSDTLAELFDFINNTDNLSPEALGEAYKFASQEYNSLMDAINKREGAAAELGKDENAAFSQLYQKSASTDAKLADTLDKMETDAQSWLGDYFRAGEQVSDAQGAAMRDYIGSYLGLREAMQPGQKLDAVRSLLAGTPLAEALMALDELAAKGQLTADSIEGLKVDNVEDAGQRVAAALALFGINLTQAADMWNAARDESRQPSGGNNPPAATVNTYGNRKTSVAAVFAAQDAGEKLWSSSGFSGTMTMDDYEHMMALDDGAYQAAIQYANGGLFFNKDVFDKLVQQKYREELNGLRKDVADTQKKYAEAAQRLTDLAEKKRSGGANLDDDAINAAISAANDDLQTAAKEMAGYRAMQAMIRNGMTGYANWMSNKSGPEMGDMYDELGVAAQAILSGKQSGKVGTRQFEAAMRWYTGQENFDVNKLTKRDWSLLRGAAGVDSTGKAVEGLPQKTVDGVLKDLQAIGVLGDHLEVLDKNMTAEKMSALYNKAYNANTDGEFMTGVFMAKNDTIQNPANKYTFGSGEDPEQAAMQDAAREFAKIAKDFKEGKVTADALLEAAGKLDEATNTALQTTGTEDAQKKAEEMVDAKTQADTLASIDKSLSNLVDISQQQLDVQTGKKSTTEDDNAGGGQGGAGGEGGPPEKEGIVELEEPGEVVDVPALVQKELEKQEREDALAIQAAAEKNLLKNRQAAGEALIRGNADFLDATLEGNAELRGAFKQLSEAIAGGSAKDIENAMAGFSQALSDAQEAAHAQAMAEAETAELNDQMALTQEDIARHQTKAEERAAAAEAEARASATEAARAELDRMTQLGGEQMADGAVDAFNALNDALTSEAANSKEISNLTQTLRGLNDATEEAQNAAQQAAEAQAKEDQHNRLLEAETPDAVAAIEDQQSQATARSKAETAARKALEEEAAAAENALRETNAQRYGEAYDKAMTSPDIDHGGPGQKALEQAFKQIGAAFEAGDWEAFESAMQNLDQVTAAVAAADQERRDREQQESDDRAAGEALQARLEEQMQNAEPPTVSTDLDKPLTEETAVSAAEETTATLAELAQADQERVAAEQEQSNLLAQNVQGQEDLTEAVQDNQPPEQPAVSTDFDTPLTTETGVSAAEAKAMEQALLAQEEAARQQMESEQELSEAVQDNTEQVAANTAATEQTTETASQEQRAKDAADLDRQEREEQAKSDAAAGKALQDRLETQSKLDQQAQWQEQLASAVEQAGGLGGITDPELRRSVENATQALEGYNTDGKVIPEQDIKDQITGAIDGMQGYLQTQVDQGQDNSVQNKKLADLEAERARKDAQNQQDMSDALRETASQATQTTAATGSSFSDMQAVTEAMSDLDKSVGQFGAAHDLTQAQQDTLSEISASLNQEYANLGEATRAFDSATAAMNQLTSEVAAQEQTEGVQQTPPAAGGSIKSTEEPVDTTSSASVEPELPSTNKELNVDTKSATISLPSGKLGISEDLSMEGWSSFYSLDNSSYANGMRPNGEALSQAEVQAVNNALTALQQALTGDDAQALTAAMGTATQIMQGNIAVSPSATEAVQSGSGSGSGGGQAPVTQATVQVTAETPEIPTPEAPSVTIPVTAEEADIPTPAVPSVVIPVSYGDPGSLSVEQPAGVTIPVAWGDPGPAPGGGGGVTLSAPMAAASGTDNACGGTTLVDELGAELIEHRSRGTYELGTDRGARFTKLDPGDIVHNAKETSKILHRGKAMWRGGVETGRAAALTKNVNALSKADIGGGARKTNYTFSADNITINATPGKSIQDGYVSSSAGDDLYKWLTSPEHAMQQAMQEHSNIQHGPSANIDKETGERIGKEFLEWLKKLIDWIPTYLSVLKKKTTAFINATDDAIHYLSKNQLLDDAIGNVAEEIKANMQAVMRYQDFLNEMASKGFSQDIIDKIQNGTIDIKEYADEDTVKSIQAYQEYWNKLVACREALQSLNAQMEALSAQKLEHVVDYFDRIDSLLRDQQKTFESLLSMKKQYGEELKVTDYVDSLQTMEQVLANAQNEETALIQELKDQLGVDGDLVNAILKGGREVWDTIAEHVKKNTYSIVEDVKPEVQAAYAESRKNAKEEEETSKKQASTFTINGTTYYKTSSGKYRSMTNGSYITASAAKQAIQNQQEVAEETKPEDLDFSITDVPVTPITDEEIIELGEKLGMVMTDGSEEALANFETIKSLLTTSWEHPLAIGSDTWYEYMSTLERLRESIYSTKTEIGELKDEMADIPLTNLKTGFDYLDEIQRNLEDMNSLLDAQGSAKYEDTYRSLISVGMKQIENLQEQNKLIQEQMDGLDPLSEKYQELRSNLNGNLDTIADIRKSQEEWNDEIIDLQIERLRKQNDSYKEQLRLMEALDDLDKARQRRLLIYHEDTGFQYEADEDELESAQEAANDAIFNNIISDLEKSKADSNIYGPLGERLISGSSILDSLGNTLIPVEDKLSGLDFEPYYQSIVSGSEQSGLLEGLLQSIDLSKLLEASIGGNVNIDIGTMTLNEVQNAKDLGDAIINQLPSYLLQALYKKGAN